LRVELVSYTRGGERLVASAAKQTISKKIVVPSLMSDAEAQSWIRELFRRQHWSPLEFSNYVFLVEGISRVASHQLVRHRIASYCQLSQRYSEGSLRRMVLTVCREKGVGCPSKPRNTSDYEVYATVLQSMSGQYIEPEKLFRIVETAYVLPPHLPVEKRIDMAYTFLRCTAMYYRMLGAGVAKEDARFLLPQAIKTTIYVSMNARELATVFLPLRMCSRAQWEIRELAWQMYRILLEVHPSIFRYTGPRCVLLENSIRDSPADLDTLLEEGFTIPRCPELVPREKIPECIRRSYR